ncbi:MAG: hypothetical protein MK289_16155 [Trichodesmium sp. ALOHA_ZT_67]|nr:hypothetical protein [Trichodesmium sp. ALOHA_ZT_67]MDE5096771.1 hypothetical protein [Trichodesmium sp. St11_bin5]MDT9341871.1 hypothetical protein [Trichodesmium erythraeum 21-75]
MVANSVYENNDLRFETTATVELIIRLPTGGNTGERNSDLNFQLRAWKRQNNQDLRKDSIYSR